MKTLKYKDDSGEWITIGGSDWEALENEAGFIENKPFGELYKYRPIFDDLCYFKYLGSVLNNSSIECNLEKMDSSKNYLLCINNKEYELVYKSNIFGITFNTLDQKFEVQQPPFLQNDDGTYITYIAYMNGNFGNDLTYVAIFDKSQEGIYPRKIASRYIPDTVLTKNEASETYQEKLPEGKTNLVLTKTDNGIEFKNIPETDTSNFVTTHTELSISAIKYFCNEHADDKSEPSIIIDSNVGNLIKLQDKGNSLGFIKGDATYGDKFNYIILEHAVSGVGIKLDGGCLYYHDSDGNDYPLLNENNWNRYITIPDTSNLVSFSDIATTTKPGLINSDEKRTLETVIKGTLINGSKMIFQGDDSVEIPTFISEDWGDEEGIHWTTDMLSINAATRTKAGVMSAKDKTKLDNINPESLFHLSGDNEQDVLIGSESEIYLEGFDVTDEGDQFVSIKPKGPSFWTGTQAEYDAIKTKDSNTFYYIIEEE